jgi:serine/threonine protein phosphatase 1
MGKFQQVERNTAGRDFAVGDIHGHFTRLQEALDRVGFDTAVDRLFSVGDLVDRGPESKRSLDWLAKPWFYAVQGNHEALAIQHVQHQNLDYQMYRASGGTWFLKLGADDQQRFANRFEQMPIAIEIDTPSGLIGIVHADCPPPSWSRLRDTLRGDLPEAQEVEQYCQWSRERLQIKDTRVVPDVRAVMVGHTPLRTPERLGNVFHIDTGGWRSDGSGFFTLVNLATLDIVAPAASKADEQRQ